MTDQERAALVAALREELRGYLARGLPERAGEVERAIAALTGEPAPAPAPPAKRAERRPRTQGEQRA